MLKKNSGQIDIFNHMIYEKLIPKDHLLIKINMDKYVPGAELKNLLREIFTYNTPSDRINSGGVLFWQENGERNIKVAYIT